MGRNPREDVSRRFQVQDVTETYAEKVEKHVAKAVSIQERIAGLEDGMLWDVITQKIRDNQLAVGVVIGIAVLLACGALYFRLQKTAALEHLRVGIATLQGGEAQKAVETLQKARSSSIGTTEQALGLYYLGEAYAKLDKKDDALKSYEQGLATVKRSAGRSYLEQLLLVKLAQMEERRGAEAQARQHYEQAKEIDGPLKLEALAAAGRLAEKLNDPNAAKSYYEQLSSGSPSYPLTEIFQAKVGK